MKTTKQQTHNLRKQQKFMCLDSIVCVITELHSADQFSHQLLHSVRAQLADLQHTFMVHAVWVLIALYHLSVINQSINGHWFKNPSTHKCINHVIQYVHLVSDQRETKDSQTAVRCHNDLGSCTHTWNSWSYRDVYSSSEK